MNWIKTFLKHPEYELYGNHNQKHRHVRFSISPFLSTVLEEVLNELKVKETITDAEASHIQKLEQSVTKRYESLDDKWDELED